MNKYSIAAVLPHKAPMILIDKLISYHQNGGVCEVTITENSAFYDMAKKGVPNYIGSEYMAQAIGAYAGALALDGGAQVKVGFILGSRKYKATNSLFNLGQTLSIEVTNLYQESSGLSVFECCISDSQQVLAQAKINVFQPQDLTPFLQHNVG